MITEFKLPELGENVQAGNVINLLVTVGDTIKPDQPVLEIETDKATVEVPSAVGGVIQTIHIKAGETIRVGQLILTVEEKDEAEAGIKDEVISPSNEPALKIEDSKTPMVESEPVKQASSSFSPHPSAFVLPELGENVQGGTVVSVLVAVGDTLTPNQPVLELETDKATVEVPASIGGEVQVVHIKTGDTVKVGQTILTVLTVPTAAKVESELPSVEPALKVEKVEVEPEVEAETLPEEFSTFSPQPTPLPAVRPAFVPPDLIAEPDPIYSAVPAAPNVRRLAREIGVDIAHVPGSGPGGRVSMADVKNYARQHRLTGSAAPAASSIAPAAPLPDFSRWGEVQRETMSNIRRKTAEHLSQAWAAIPHVTQFTQADIGELEELRKRFSKNVEAVGAKLTLTAILLKVVVSALKAFPQFNASVDMARNEIVYKKYYHIGVAVDTDRGLLVPVIRDVERKNILELALELNEIAERARTKKLTLEDMQGGTFTLTNLGGIGGSFFTPIVNAPEVAILGVARGQMQPVYNPKSGQFEPHLMLPLALSYDHRLIDGADGARFLKSLVEHLEQPFLTALQGW